MMGVIVHRSNGENRFYVHDVIVIKEEATPFMTGTQNMGEPGGATSTISVIRKILDVKRKKDGNLKSQFSISPVADSEVQQAEQRQDPSKAE